MEPSKKQRDEIVDRLLSVDLQSTPDKIAENPTAGVDEQTVPEGVTPSEHVQGWQDLVGELYATLCDGMEDLIGPDFHADETERKIVGVVGGKVAAKNINISALKYGDEIFLLSYLSTKWGVKLTNHRKRNHGKRQDQRDSDSDPDGSGDGVSNGDSTGRRGEAVRRADVPGGDGRGPGNGRGNRGGD